MPLTVLAMLVLGTSRLADAFGRSPDRVRTCDYITAGLVACISVSP